MTRLVCWDAAAIFLVWTFLPFILPLRVINYLNVSVTNFNFSIKRDVWDVCTMKFFFSLLGYCIGGRAGLFNPILVMIVH